MKIPVLYKNLNQKGPIYFTSHYFATKCKYPHGVCAWFSVILFLIKVQVTVKKFRMQMKVPFLLDSGKPRFELLTKYLSGFKLNLIQFYNWIFFLRCCVLAIPNVLDVLCFWEGKDLWLISSVVNLIPLMSLTLHLLRFPSVDIQKFGPKFLWYFRVKFWRLFIKRRFHVSKGTLSCWFQHTPGSCYMGHVVSLTTHKSQTPWLALFMQLAQ